MGEKKSTGPNARPKDATIAQTGEGLPDDSAGLPEGAENVDEEKARASLDRLERDKRKADKTDE